MRSLHAPASKAAVSVNRRRRAATCRIAQSHSSRRPPARRSPRTNNRSATRPDPLHLVHRHDVGRTRARDRTALDDRRNRNEADAIAAVRRTSLSSWTRRRSAGPDCCSWTKPGVRPAAVAVPAVGDSALPTRRSQPQADPRIARLDARARPTHLRRPTRPKPVPISRLRSEPSRSSQPAAPLPAA